MPKIYAFSKNRHTLEIIRTPDLNAVTETAPDEFLPAMTWADWELLQALHRTGGAQTVNNVVEVKAPAAGKPVLNKDAIIADLKDQIKDWETKCRVLEEKNENQRQVIELTEERAIALSKHLQHYRAAYFSDTGNNE